MHCCLLIFKFLVWIICAACFFPNLFINFPMFCFCLCRLCVIAGNISPIDVITHVPILCEEANIPYVYVPSKEVYCTEPATLTLNPCLCFQHEREKV